MKGTENFYIHNIKGGSKSVKIIKIYRHYDGKTHVVAECSINFSTKIVYYMYDVERNPSAGYVIRAKIINCRSGEEARMMDDVREVIEVILESELIKDGGIKGIIDHYKPPVGGPIVQINGVGYSWTIEEEPLLNHQR
jgi:hypothetical protein